MFIEQRALVNH